MVDAKKHKAKSTSNETADDSYVDKNKMDMLFCKGMMLSTETAEYVRDKFGKEFDDADFLNIATTLAYEIITAESDDDKDRIKKTVCDIVDDKYNLNEFIFTNLASHYAFNKVWKERESDDTLTGDNLMERLDEVTDNFQYLEWKKEMKLIKESAESGENRLKAINGGA